MQPDRVVKRQLSMSWDFSGTAVKGFVHRAASVYRALAPPNWPMASQSQDLDTDETSSDEAFTARSETSTPTWPYQTGMGLRPHIRHLARLTTLQSLAWP